MLVRFLGDTHGVLDQLGLPAENTIQVGDFNGNDPGFWYWLQFHERRGDVDYYTPVRIKFPYPIAFIDGNHERFTAFDTSAPSIQRVESNVFYIPRGYVSGKVMFFGGADSVDKPRWHPKTSQIQRGNTLGWWESARRPSFMSPAEYRSIMESLHWYEEEQITKEQVEAAEKHQGGIEVIVSHDVPRFLVPKFMQTPIDTPSQLSLESLFARFSPKLWVFGHYHVPVDITVHGCRFVCLDKGTSCEFDVPIEPDFFDRLKTMESEAKH